ncbi:MAG: hypothetical protein Rv1118c, partial [uncultured Corynebacteriales bacterium]
ADHAGRGARGHQDRRPVDLPRVLGGRPGDPGLHQRTGQPRRDDGRAGGPARPDVARRAGPLAAGPVVGRPAPRGAAARRPGGGDRVGPALRTAGLAAPARPGRHPGDGGRAAADHRPAGRHPVPEHDPDGDALADRPGAGAPAALRRRPGDRVLRRGGGQHLPGDGAAARPPAPQLVRPGEFLERRRPGADRPVPARRRGRGHRAGDGL